VEIAEEERLSLSVLGLSLPNAVETTSRPVADWEATEMHQEWKETPLLSGDQTRAKLRGNCEQYTQKR
jgi:hypothetical protein